MFKDVILEEWGNITAETKKTSSFHAETRYRNFAEKASKLQATKNGPLFYVIYRIYKYTVRRLLRVHFFIVLSLKCKIKCNIFFNNSKKM